MIRVTKDNGKLLYIRYENILQFGDSDGSGGFLAIHDPVYEHADIIRVQETADEIWELIEFDRDYLKSVHINGSYLTPLNTYDLTARNHQILTDKIQNEDLL